MAKTIADYKKDYAAAQARGDAAGMKAANDGANAIRAANGQKTYVASNAIAATAAANKGGSSTGSSSSSRNNNAAAIGSALGGLLSGGSPVGTALGATIGSAASAITNRNKNTGSQTTQTPNYIANLTQPAGTDYSILLKNAMNAGATGDEVQRLLDARTDKAMGSPDLQKYAYDDVYKQAMQYINNFQTLAQLETEKPTLDDDWRDYTDQQARDLLAMSYEDWLNGDQYQALADRFSLHGRRSMDDLLGQLSSRTGGLASSYAVTAAQQQYNDYMAQLEEVARQMYSGDRSDMFDNVQLAQGLADRDYSRYQDSLDRYYQDRDYQYQLNRDQIADDRYDREYADSLAATSKGDAQDRINAYLAAYGRAADLDAALIAASGYTPAELSALENYYADMREMEALKASSGGGSGRGSGGSSSSGAMDFDGLYQAAKDSGSPASFLKQKSNYKRYGFDSAPSYNDYKNWLTRKQNAGKKQSPVNGYTSMADLNAESNGSGSYTSNADKGSNFNSVWLNARRKYDSGASAQEIIQYLVQQGETGNITSAGQDYILDKLNLG